LEQALRSQLDPQSAARQAALEGLGADLAALAGAADASPELDELATLLQELATEVSTMSEQEREALAGALGEAAAQLAGGDSALAGALSQLAQEVQDGQPSGESVAAAAQALEGAAAEAARQQALARALNSARAASDALSQAGGAAQAASGQGPSGQSGQGQGQTPGQGQAPGQGQGQTPGQGTSGGGGGTLSPSGPPSTRPGRAGTPTNPNKPYEVSDLDTIVAPWQRGQPGDPDFVPGRQTGQGQETVGEETDPQTGTPGAVTVPYAEVYASYSAAAAEALEREYVPAGLKQYVQDYFSKLEP